MAIYQFCKLPQLSAVILGIWLVSDDKKTSLKYGIPSSQNSAGQVSYSSSGHCISKRGGTHLNSRFKSYCVASATMRSKAKHFCIEVELNYEVTGEK